ncbi:S41 family peptidase [Cytophagales bacterium LB-30]|uniref:S41 family peptidase n=1 Tax=Shiella aurantiaca TaxID=3058365 RepID=A0ABT8F731_9BACT|nr:S41 family peptidase [Shiella aurantiaca]MDN4166174.1 S41 family peptidase [Shiella aurantiaca]
MRKNIFKRLIYSVFASLLFIVLFVAATRSDRYFEIAKNLDIMATLFREVNTYYVDEVNPAKLMQTGMIAMLESLDPYTNYIAEDDIEDYMTMTTGQYAGVGLLIGRVNEQNVVIMPYEGYSAQKNGLKIGDKLLKVDEVDVTKKSTEEIGRLLKGQVNTSLNITVQRFGKTEPITVTLQREKVTISNVPFHGMISSDVAYIKLSDFTQGAGREVRDALVELKAKGAKKVILDLRDNPGGLLSEAINVSNVFIPKGKEVVTTRGKVTEWNKTYATQMAPADTEIPVAVLTSSGSASAAEIVAGVIQDYDRGVLVGQKTFGKGLVQATRPLTYNAQLKVTTAKYYTPSGRCIQALDYSNRNEDGSVGKVPDSLKVAFKTTNGRVVYDGGGVDPEIVLDKQVYAPITVSLVSKGLVFQYANEFHYKNPTIASAESFSLSNAQYQEFCVWLKDKEYDYTTKVEKTMNELIESAKKEKYYSDIKAQIESLDQQIKHNKETDLQKFATEIRHILEEEIASRYYFQKGLIQASLSHDAEVKKALEILNTTDSYNQLLARK